MRAGQSGSVPLNFNLCTTESRNPMRSLTFLSALFLMMLLFQSCASPSGGGPVVRPAGDPIAFGIVDGLESKVLGEDRTLNILLPPSYENSEKRYPVIYLLDGATNEDYHHVAGIVEFLTTYQLMPESILVGIANTNRGRDFTHPSRNTEDRKAIPAGGGSARFMDFLGLELQPYIESYYRATRKRMIIGQSLGGLLATEVLLTRNRLFDTYIIVSPSLWWADGDLVKGASTSGFDIPRAKKTVVLSIGTEHPAMHEGMDALRGVLGTQKDSIQVLYRHLPDETHATILHRAIYGALEALYHEEYPGL